MLKLSAIQQNALTPPIRDLTSSSFLELRGGAATEAAASKFEPFIQKFIGGSHGNEHIIAAIILTILLKPAAKLYYEHISSIFQNSKGGDGVVTKTNQERPPFTGTRFYKVVETIAEAARLLIIVEAFDLLKVSVLHLGVKLPNSENLTDVFGWGILLLWGSRKISALKLYLLKKMMPVNESRRVSFINNLSDYLLLFIGIFAFYEVLNVEMGYSAKSLLGLLSLCTAAIALATKDIITNFLNGVILSASDRIYEGDTISFEGEVQKVTKLGWLETTLSGGDNVLFTVPNTELVSAKLSNLSRVETCQVLQKLKFPKSAMDKLPKLSADIKNEIRSACPSVITDNSHPFSCYWIDFHKDQLVVTINAHFRIHPVGDAALKNQQQCLLAIDRAIRRNEIESYAGA